MNDAQARRAIQRGVTAIRYAGWRRVLSGRRTDASTVTMIGAPSGKVWVRFPDESREETAVWGSVNVANAPIIIAPGFDGQYEVVSPDWSAGTAALGDSVRSILLPPGGETVPWSIPATGITEGRLSASDNGGLYVHTGAFTYDGGVHLGGTWDAGGGFDATAYDESVSAYLPATSGHTGWVGRYFDPSDASFHFVAGATAFTGGDTRYLDERDLADLALPAGCYPLGAVGLNYGQTTVVGGRFASWRLFLNPHADIVTNADVDARLLELLEDGARITRLTGMGIGGSQRLNPVAAALLKRPYTS